MNRFVFASFFSLFMLVINSFCFANSEKFQSANSDFESGYYDSSIIKYQQLLNTESENKIVYYNLAKSYEANGNNAQAIYNYYQALRIDPGWETAANNLQHIQPQSNEQDENTTSYIFSQLFRESNPWIWVIIFQLAIFLFLIMLIYYVRKIPNLADKFPAILFLGTFVLIIIACAGIMEAHQHLRKLGVDAIVMEEVVARQGAGNQYFEAIELEPGTAIQLREAPVDGWVKIKIMNGTIGYVQVEKIRPL